MALPKLLITIISHYYILQHFKLDLKRLKHSTHHTQVKTTNSTSNNNNNYSGHGSKGRSQNSGHGGGGNDTKSNANPNQISFPNELWEYLPNSVKSTISQHNHKYNVDTAHQDHGGHIPKALWDQLPPHAKSAVSKSQCHTKQQANSILTIMLIIFLLIPYLHMPLILYIACLWKQPLPPNQLQYLIQ